MSTKACVTPINDCSPTAPGKLERHLSNRHIQLMSIGGAVGTGLFMGSGKVIALSGTSIVLVYAVTGFFVFMMMRALGELLLSNLEFGSFCEIVHKYLGPMAGFTLTWSYWLAWAVAVIADVIVVGGYFQYWFPQIPTWIPAFFTLFLLISLNCLAVKVFGEVEFWFAAIKVVAIVMLILTSVWMVATSYISPSGITASYSHLIEPGVILPHGLTGFLAGFQIAIFSFTGAEIVGTTAAEAKNPEKVLPKAINNIPVRILMFNVISLIGIISVMSYNGIIPNRSPFVELFVFAGLPAAAGIINFVVLTSSASSANSGIYSGCRMLFGLAKREAAPSILAKTSKAGSPIYGVIFTGVCTIVGTAILLISPEFMTAFTIVSTICAILGIFSWCMILAAYIAYVNQDKEKHLSSKFRLPGGRLSAAIALLFFITVVGLMSLESDTRTALMVMPIWFIFITAIYLKKYSKKWIIHQRT